MSFQKPKSSMEMRSTCLLCEWAGEWVRTPGEALQNFSTHLLDTHPEVLRDPVKLRQARKDEFRYGQGEE